MSLKVKAVLLLWALPACQSEGLLLESRRLDQAGGVAAGGAPTGSITLTPRPARDFVESVGLTVRLRNAGELETARRAFAELKISHARTFVPPPALAVELEHVAALGEQGVRFNLIVDPRFGHDVSSVTQLIASQPSLESVEGPNDFDAYATDLSGEEIRAAMLGLRAGIEAAPRTVALVDGLDSTATGAGDLSNTVDYGNFERLRTRQLPGRDLSPDIEKARAVCGDKPLFVTECGYSNFADDAQSVSEEVAARYIPRLLLAHFELGIVRTYLDELFDDAAPQSPVGAQGLLRGDGSKKPAYESLRRLLSRLYDPVVATPTPLALGFDPAAESVRRIALERSDGTAVLLIWNEVPSVDPSTGSELSVEPISTVLELAAPRTYAVYRPLTTEPPTASGASARIELMVADDVLVVELDP